MPFTAATSVVQGAIGQGTWVQREEVLTKSISEFPGLGNYPRIILISKASEGAQEMSDEEFSSAVEAVTTEGQAGLDDEPENWRLRAVLAQFYQIASYRDSAYLAVAREHIDEAARTGSEDSGDHCALLNSRSSLRAGSYLCSLCQRARRVRTTDAASRRTSSQGDMRLM